LVVGPSGSGKSSLILAGVLPRFTTNVATFRPGEHPAQRLAESLPLATPRLLFIDQLEELFTLASDEERASFIAALRAQHDRGGCQIVFALRADFYGALMSSDLWTLIDGHAARLDVGPLRGDPLMRAIEAPANAAGVFIEPTLVQRLATDAASEPGSLPLLQEVMVVLWERRQRRLLRLSDYKAMGADKQSGLAVVTARRADAVILGLSDTQRELARRIFLRLVSFGEGRPDTRRQQPLDTMRSGGESETDFDEVVRVLTNERLLTLSGVGNRIMIDLSHETLLAGWPMLAHWISETHEAEQTRRRLEAKADEWVRLGRGQDALLDAAELGETDRWLKSAAASELGVSETLDALVERSRQTLERQEQNNLEISRRTRRSLQVFRALAITLSVVFLLTVSVSYFAWRARSEAQLQARQADSRRLAMQALTQSAAEPDRALLLAVEASRLDDNIEARHGLATIIDRANHILRYLPIAAEALAASPSGLLVATDSGGFTSANRRRTITIWNFPSWSVRKVLEVPDDLHGVLHLAFSQEDRALAAVEVSPRDTNRDAKQPVVVWDLQTGAHSALTSAWSYDGVAFDSDGSVILSSARDSQRWTLASQSTDVLIHCDEPNQAVSANGRVSICVTNKRLQVFDLRTRQKIREIPTTFESPGLLGLTLAISRTGKLAAIQLAEGLTLFDLQSGETVQLDWALATIVSYIEFSADERHLLILRPTNENSMSLSAWEFEAEADRASGTPWVKSSQPLPIDLAEISTAPKWLPDGHSLILGGSRLSIVAPEDKTPKFEWTVARSEGSERRWPASTSTAAEYFGTSLRVAERTGDLVEFEINHPQSRKQRRIAPDALTAAAFGPAAGWLAWTSGSPAELWVQNVTAGTPPQRISDGPASGALAWNPAGSLIAFPQAIGVRVARREGGPSRQLKVADHDQSEIVNGLSFVDEDRIAVRLRRSHGSIGDSGLNEKIEIWQQSSGRLLRTLRDISSLPNTPIVVVGADRSVVAWISDRETVGLWKVEEDGTPRMVRLRHTGLEADPSSDPISKLVPSPDGRLLAVVCNDRVSVVDVGSGHELRPKYSVAEGSVVAFGPDSQSIAVIERDSSQWRIRVWDLGIESWRNQACNIANRQLSPEEWREFVGDRPYLPGCNGD